MLGIWSTSSNLVQPSIKGPPIGTHDKIAQDETRNSVGQTLCKSIIGSLLYLTTNRPNIFYNVGVCARYQANPRDSHLLAVKKIIKYMSGTTYYGLLYTGDKTTSLVDYCNVDWAGSSKDRNSTSLRCWATTLHLGLARNRTAYRFPQSR